MNRRTWLQCSCAGFAGLVGFGGIKSVGTQLDPAESNPVVLPHPQSIHFGTQEVELIRNNQLSVSIQPDPSAGGDAMHAARFIAAELFRRTGKGVPVLRRNGEGFPIRLSTFDHSRTGNETEVEGGYRVMVTSAGAQIESRGVGFGYASSTFIQLLEGWEAPRLRTVEIADWPVFPFRGIYVEVTSAACMSLQDWKELLDRAAFLKLNTVVVGLYNCWQRPATVLDCEYFLFPSRKYPQFKTPVRTYVRRQGQWVEKVGLPAMVREDFLGEVVAYGKARGITVAPYFSSLGHNTLIPRLMPEISMKDEQCHPIGYGFCTTCPKTYEVLFNLYDEIIERYAKPYGITAFHIGMDEVAQVCQCPSCMVAWQGENNFYVNHLIKISRYLKEQGMTRVLMWNDMLHRSGLINQHLKSRFVSAGVEDLMTICWWYYGAPREGYFSPNRSFSRAFFRPQIGVQAWATPSAGWDTTGLLADNYRTANEALFRLIRQGKSRGANGVISYSNHDPMFEQGYVNLSQYSWNPKPGLAETQTRYARWLFGGDSVQGAEARKLYRKAHGIYAGLAEVFYRRPTPPRLGEAMASMAGVGLEKKRFEESLRALGSAAHKLGTIQKGIRDPGKAQIVRMYRVEVRRLRALLRMALEIFECTAAYDDFRSVPDVATLSSFAERIGSLRQSLEYHRAVLRELENVRYTPSLPRFIPYEIQAQKDMQQFIKVFSKIEQRAREGKNGYLPEIVIAGENFFATRLAMVLPEGPKNSGGSEE